VYRGTLGKKRIVLKGWGRAAYPFNSARGANAAREEKGKRGENTEKPGLARA